MNKSADETITRNYLDRFEGLVLEYERIKRGEHPRYRFVKDFFADVGIAHQNFAKYYHRYRENGRSRAALAPQKRGPKYKTRRIGAPVEAKIVELRQLGLNRYEIQQIITQDQQLPAPCLTTIYNYCVKHKLNVLNLPLKEAKTAYVRQVAGELAHVDCHSLGKHTIRGVTQQLYVVGLIDDATRLAWAEVATDVKSLSVMFATLHNMNMLRAQYGVEFLEVLTDNGAEFGKRVMKDKSTHPFERLLIEMNITHRYTRPYRPQTNGKIERFWRTLYTDLIEHTDFDSLEELKDELLQYLYYYNTIRPHQALMGDSPANYFAKLKDASK